MLIFNVLDNRIPAVLCYSESAKDQNAISPSIVVDLISITWGIYNIEPQSYTVFLDDCKIVSLPVYSGRNARSHTVGDSLDFCSCSHRLIWSQTALRVDQMRGKDGIDKG